MTDTIDKLIFALGGDLKDLNAAYADAEKGAQKTGTTIQQNLGKGFQEAAAAAQTHSATIKKTFTETSAEAENFGNNVNISRRELVYLVRELVSGDFQRAPATIALMTSHFLELSGATIAVGAGILAIPAAMAIVAEKADASLAKLRTSLALTGFASGISANQASVAASQIANQVPMGIFGARNFVAGMASGMVPGSAMVQAGVAAGNYGKATGASTEETQKIIKEMFTAPSKSAEELNASMNLLTDAQTRQVEVLEKSGEYQKAGQLVLDAFSGRAKEAAAQAGFLATAMSNASSNFSSFGAWLAHLVGVGLDDSTKLKDLQDARPFMARAVAVGAIPQSRLDEQDAKIAALQSKIALNDQNAADLGHRANNNRLVTAAMKDVDSQSGAFAKHQEDLNEELERDRKAVAADTEQRHKGTDDLAASTARARQLQAVTLAAANQKSPAQLAEQEAKDARYLAGLPSDRVAVASARLQAQRTYEKNLANPATALDADAIRKADLAKADVANAQKIRAQNEEISGLQLHAKNQLSLVAAYKEGKDAALALAAAEDAEEAAAKHSIRTTQEHAKTVADLKTAFAAASRSVAENNDLQGDVTAGLRNEAAAGGNPAAVRNAKIETDALKETEGERDAALALKRVALTREENAEADKAVQTAADDLEIAIKRLHTQQDLNDAIASNAQAETARRALGNASGQLSALAGGAGPDDLRHLQVQQSTIDDLIRRGYDPATAEFKKQLQILLPLNEALSDANDSLQKMRQYSSDLASSITGPLRDFLRNGGNPLDALANMGQNTLDTLVSHEIIDPLQKSLEGLFGSALGTPKDLLGTSPATPMYVSFGPLGGAGGNGGGGGLLSLLGGGGGGSTGDWAGSIMDDGSVIGSGAEAAGSGGFLSSLLAFAGLFDSGGTIGPGQWGIKSGMPEIIQGGTQGVSILPLTAPVVRAAAGAMGRGPGVNSSPGGPGNGGYMDGNRVVHNWNISTPDAGTFIRSRSQIEARFTMAAARGQRNS